LILYGKQNCALIIGVEIREVQVDKVVIVVRGGTVQDIMCTDEKLAVEVFDFDRDGRDNPVLTGWDPRDLDLAQYSVLLKEAEESMTPSFEEYISLRITESYTTVQMVEKLSNLVTGKISLEDLAKTWLHEYEQYVARERLGKGTT
jgi:hypothetical protein